MEGVPVLPYECLSVRRTYVTLRSKESFYFPSSVSVDLSFFRCPCQFYLSWSRLSHHSYHPDICFIFSLFLFSLPVCLPLSFLVYATCIQAFLRPHHCIPWCPWYHWHSHGWHCRPQGLCMCHFLPQLCPVQCHFPPLWVFFCAIFPPLPCMWNQSCCQHFQGGVICLNPQSAFRYTIIKLDTCTGALLEPFTRLSQ